MPRHIILLVLTTVLAAGEPLVCRGFDAASAVQAVVSSTGQLLRLDPGLGKRPVWFALAGRDPAPARQALAHAIGCWWTSSASGQLTRNARLSAADAGVRTYPPLPLTVPDGEALLRRLLDPWLAGDGGLALDTLNHTWNATASPSGLARLEELLGALADPAPRAPHLLPDCLPAGVFARSPRGAALGAWSLDLAACSGLAVAMSGDCDPAAPAPTGDVSTLREAIAALAAGGLSAALHHGCLCIGLAEPLDRLHPAERAAVAILPIGHLCRDDAQMVQLSAQLGARVAPPAWDMPGWAIAALAWRRCLLVVADPPTIHQVMTALEAADQIGLEAWLR